MPSTPDLAAAATPPAMSWPLAMLQSRLAAALMAADDVGRQMPEALFAGALPGAEGLRVHRNTVLGALSHALRLGYPAVDRLVGEAFFDRMAVDFARAQPPTAPTLSDWGAAFAQFIDQFPGTERLPYLSELAYFDARFDQLARCVPDEEFHGVEVTVASDVTLCFTAGLLVHSSAYPVSALRDAILADDAATLGAIERGAAGHHVAMWRSRAGVMVQPLGAGAACFVNAALGGATGEQALAAAAAGVDAQTSEAELAAQLQSEVLQSSFARIRTSGNSFSGAGQ